MNISIYKFLQKLNKFIKRKCPLVDKLLYGPKQKYIFSRTTIGYIYGIIMGYLFWEFIIYSIGLPVMITYSCLGVLMIFLGIGCAFFTQIRCICILTWLGFCGRAGRNVTKALVFSFIISGPITNIATNAREVVRVFSCSTVLTYNLTKTRFDLMTSPFHNAMMGMKRNISHVKDSFQSIEDVVAPIIDEIEGEDDKEINRRESNLIVKDGSYYQERYSRKLKHRCEEQLRRGAMKCKNAFIDAHDRCYDVLPIIARTLLCWPMKLDYVCNIGESLGIGKGKKGPCDPSQAIDSDLGDNYSKLINVESRLLGNFSKVHLNYTFVEPTDIPGLKSAEETGKSIVKEFTKKKTIFDRCFFIVKRILAFIFLKIVFEAVSYHNQYLSKIEFDNTFVTGYFKQIDRRRRERHQPTLLPLKKIERQNIVDPLTSDRGKREYVGMIGHFIKLILEFITASCFILLDHIFTESLDLVARHAEINYIQQGVHDVNITIVGSGIIASLVRTAVSGFSSSERIYRTATNKACLPIPSHTTHWCLIRIYGAYTLIFFLIYNEIYVQRLRRIVCSYFYHKREKKRILYLYNKLLKRRRGLFKHLSQIVKDKIKEDRLTNQTDEGLLMKLRIKFPKYFEWLRFFKVARRKCIICNEVEPRKRDYTRPFHFASCVTPGCNVVHCEDCWFDIGEVCLACLKYQNETDGDENRYSEYYKTDISD